MQAAFIIPTGIGCEIGGHAGDATPALKLIASVCDTVVTHPNVVNASDINEMPVNALYVEGSMLDRYLAGEISLVPSVSNRILVVVNAPARPETINAVSAAMSILGVTASIMELKKPLIMRAKFNDDGTAGGTYSNTNGLIEEVRSVDFDALAIATPIEYDPMQQIEYFRTGGVNPWGAIEATVSKIISQSIMKPVAHAPIETETPEIKEFNEVVDPRMAAEMVSFAYLHCVLKGLYTAPRIIDERGFKTNKPIDVLISPMCWGEPHRICEERGIPIIYVKENTTVQRNNAELKGIIVENYLEAAGVVAAVRAGISRESLRRPLAATTVIRRI